MCNLLYHNLNLSYIQFLQKFKLFPPSTFRAENSIVKSICIQNIFPQYPRLQNAGRPPDMGHTASQLLS